MPPGGIKSRKPYARCGPSRCLAYGLKMLHLAKDNVGWLWAANQEDLEPRQAPNPTMFCPSQPSRA